MRAVTDGSKAVERSCVLACDIAVRNATRDPFLEFDSKSPSRFTGGFPKLEIPWGGLHRWHIHGALNRDPGPGNSGLEPVNGLLDLQAVRHRGNPDIDDGLAEWRDDVGPDAAIDLSHVHGDPALGIVEVLKSLNYVGKLENRVRAGLGIEPGMRLRPSIWIVNCPAPLRAVFSLPERPRAGSNT